MKLLPFLDDRSCLREFMDLSGVGGLDCEHFVVAMLELKFHQLETERIDYLKHEGANLHGRQMEYETETERKNRQKRRRQTKNFMNSALNILRSKNKASRRNSIDMINSAFVELDETLKKTNPRKDSFSIEMNRRLSLSQPLTAFYSDDPNDTESHLIRDSVKHRHAENNSASSVIDVVQEEEEDYEDEEDFQ